MTQTRFDGQACRKTLASLDSYIDNELLTESNLELMEHFQRCRECTREAQERRNVRTQLQTAVRDVKVPADLEARVRDRLRQTRQPQHNRFHLMAIAAALAVCFGSWIGYQRSALLSTRAMATILRVGLGDHVHCAVPRQTMAPSQVAVDKLPAEYKELIPIVHQHVLPKFPLVLAHECGYQGRKFVHLTFRTDRGLLSLVITRKQKGESLATGMRATNVRQFQVAAFESRGFLIYTVSDLPPQKNLDILVALAPSLQHFLDQMGA